jgi:nicotinate phosphoribosyltransferase
MMPEPLRSALFTDLYQLTMAQAYAAEDFEKTAVFELFFREMPPTRNYFVAAGLDDVLTYLEGFRFTDDDLAYLGGLGQFSSQFLDRLKSIRFTGDVYAVPEGTAVFSNEPLVQIVAPLIEAQLIETLVLNQVHFQTVAATKAARIVTAAAGRDVVDFGSRRAHGADAAIKVARVSYLAGAVGTSLTLAGKIYGIPVFGTMAHSYIQAHEDEAAAFTAFTALYPGTTLLIDTYDSLKGIRKVIDLAQKLGERFQVGALRLDSGDIGLLARQARQMLDEAGLCRVRIFVSSEMDEYRIAELLASGAPIDGFGVGTRMAVADDAPHIDMAYKLVEYAGRPTAKHSPRKTLYPGRKQIVRMTDGGCHLRDVLCQYGEDLPGEPLLRPVMRNGQRLPAGRVSLADSRRHALHERECLPAALRALEPSRVPFQVEVSERLKASQGLGTDAASKYP